jgi:phosphate/sulfate permease
VTALKSFSKYILYAGAVACCLAGLGPIYLVINTHWGPDYPPDPFTFVLIGIYVCLAITPAFMFLKGLKTKTWHWVSIAIVEAIVLAPVLGLLVALIKLAEGEIPI